MTQQETTLPTYGKELILDLHGCDPKTFTYRSIKRFMRELCERIDMVRGPLYWRDDFLALPWQWETEPHLKGTAAVQFTHTSNITIHTLEFQEAVRLNVFICKDFDPQAVRQFVVSWFGGEIVNDVCIDRY